MKKIFVAALTLVAFAGIAFAADQTATPKEKTASIQGQPAPSDPAPAPAQPAPTPAPSK